MCKGAPNHTRRDLEFHIYQQYKKMTVITLSLKVKNNNLSIKCEISYTTLDNFLYSPHYIVL